MSKILNRLKSIHHFKTHLSHGKHIQKTFNPLKTYNNDSSTYKNIQLTKNIWHIKNIQLPENHLKFSNLFCYNLQLAVSHWCNFQSSSPMLVLQLFSAII